MESGQRRGHDAAARDHSEGRRSTGHAGSGGRGGGCDAGRARSHQEGQEGRGRRGSGGGARGGGAGSWQEREEIDVKLIVGLGNPGTQYRDTRHNVGFKVVEEVARRHGARFDTSPSEAEMAKVRNLGETAVLLAKPLTFMNLSGHAAGELLRYFKIDTADLLVVADDVNLPLGRLRDRKSTRLNSSHEWISYAVFC